MDKAKIIEMLEERNSELAKEILLNEAAVYEAEKELNKIDSDLLNSQLVQNHIRSLKFWIERIETRNTIYKKEIFENDLHIKRLSHEE